MDELKKIDISVNIIIKFVEVVQEFRVPLRGLDLRRYYTHYLYVCMCLYGMRAKHVIRSQIESQQRSFASL